MYGHNKLPQLKNGLKERLKYPQMGKKSTRYVSLMIIDYMICIYNYALERIKMDHLYLHSIV